MLHFWRNPEFVRHLRADLRPARALTAATLAVIVSTLVGLYSWALNRPDTSGFLRNFHGTLVTLQYVVLGVWCATSCGQAISREREVKTYDFLRTTRLTAAELMVGKLLGAPIAAYFVVGCTLPISVVTGILAGFPLPTLVWPNILMLALALFVSVISLWVSMLVEKASAGSVGLLALLPVGIMVNLASSPFPGIAALSVLAPLASLYRWQIDVAKVTPTFVGFSVSFVFLALLLYALFGAWFVLMLVRNLKKDQEQTRLLSRWQAVGFAGFLNLLFYALLDPRQVGPSVTRGYYSWGLRPSEVSTLAMVINWMILFFIGVATLTPREKLRVWWRKHAVGEASYLSEYGLPWPWLAPAAATAYALLVAEAAGMRGAITFGEWKLGTAAVQLLVVLVFTSRDVLFLQWCTLTGMKRPLTTGVFYLILYQGTVGVLTLVATIINRSVAGYVSGLAPFCVFTAQDVGWHASTGIYTGLALQVPVIFLLLKVTDDRLRRPTIVPAAPLPKPHPRTNSTGFVGSSA